MQVCVGLHYSRLAVVPKQCSPIDDINNNNSSIISTLFCGEPSGKETKCADSIFSSESGLTPLRKEELLWGTSPEVFKSCPLQEPCLFVQ